MGESSRLVISGGKYGQSDVVHLCCGELKCIIILVTTTKRSVPLLPISQITLLPPFPASPLESEQTTSIFPKRENPNEPVVGSRELVTLYC